MSNVECDALKFSDLKDKLHPKLLKLLPYMSNGKLDVTGKMPDDGPYLIVFNHLCIEDFPTLGEAISDHIYALISDEDKYTLSGLAMTLNGVEWVNRLSKEKRKLSEKNVIKILKAGYSCAMCPEATWNLTENQLIMPMNYGCIRIALEAGVKILPVVSYFSDDKRYTTIGEPFTPTENLISSISELRDTMSNMLYTQIQKVYEERFNSNDENIDFSVVDGKKYFYEITRKDIDKRYWEDYIDGIYRAYPRTKRNPGAVRKYESQFIFTPKSDDYDFFQAFNSVVRQNQRGGVSVQRISSSFNGFNEEYSENKDFFGYGYNEKLLDKYLGETENGDSFDEDKPKVFMKK